MKINRETSVFIKFVLDECLPPILRDSFLYRWFQRVALGKSARYFIRFRSQFLGISHKELARWYSSVEKDNVHSTSDLSKESIVAVRQLVVGKTVLDIACGRGYLSTILGDDGFTVTAADFVISKHVHKHPRVLYTKANIEDMSFPNKSFDTTVSAHTLEHTLDIAKAISELRRVTKKRLVVVLPKERPYKYGCNFHTHFFPYEYSIYQVFGYFPKKQSLSLVGGDWLYVEDLG
jgi:ubiquinone/menaquinone biosynthesis C-methylase UbiE